MEGAAVGGEDVGSPVGALDGCFVGLDVGSLVGAAVVGEDVLPCSANQSNVRGSPQGVDGSMNSEVGFESMKSWALPGIA